MAERWAAKPKNFATIRKTIDGKKWWVRPQAKTPKGGTAATSPRSAAINRLVPRDYAGDPSVIGGWKAEPRLSPDQYEWTPNEAGRWFARPRTETTGLDPQQKADLAAFDRQTGAQQARISEVYNNYATQAGADRDAAAKAFGTLSGLSAAGYQDAQTGQASGPYGAVQGRPLSQAERALPGILAQGAREQSQAAAGQSLFSLNQLPTLARDAGVTALERYGADRGGQRSEFISTARKTAADQRAADAESAYNQQRLAADLRGQNLSLLGRQIGADTQIQTAGIRASTATSDRVAKLKTERARLMTQLQIARERNMTSRANTIENNIAKKDAAIRKEQAKSGGTNADKRAWVKRAREMWDGIPRRTTGPDGKSVTQYIQYSRAEIMRELMAQGVSRKDASAIVNQITGNPNAAGAARAAALGGSPAGY